MQRSNFPLIIRLFFIVGTLTGLLLVFFSQVSFDILANIINGLAQDGQVDSFTEAGFQISSILMLFLGIIIALSFSGFLVFEKKSYKFFSFIWNWSRAEWGFTRNDAKTFWDNLLPGIKRRNEILIILLVVLIAIIVRMSNLFIPLDHDEAYTYNAFASHSLWHVISDYHLPNNHVFLTIAITILTGLFGNHLWLIRIPGLIAGVCMVPAGYWLAKHLYNKETAIVSAVFIAFFPILVKYSVLARGYAVISLFTLLIFWLGNYVRTHRNRFAWMLLVILSALGFYTVPVMFFPFGAFYVWLLISCLVGDIASYRSIFEFIKFYFVAGTLVVALTTILYSPILLNPSSRLFRNKFIAPLGWDEYPSVLWFRLQNTWADWMYTIPDWLVIFGVVGLLFSIVFHNKLSKQKVPLQAAFMIWILSYVIFRRPDMETRMWTFLAAPLLIWSAGGLVGALNMFTVYIGNKAQLGRKFSGLVLLSSLIGIIFVVPTIPIRWQTKGSVENIAIFFKDQLQVGDFVSLGETFSPQLRYYFNVYNIPLTYLRRPAEVQRVFVIVRSVDWSAAAGETLEVAAPKNENGLIMIELETSKVLFQFEDLALYESYHIP